MQFGFAALQRLGNARRTSAISPEFLLLVECCRRNFAGRDARPGPWEGAIDWPRFVELAGRHRVEGLAFHGLRAIAVDVPAAAHERLAADTRAIAAHDLRCALASAVLRDAFAGAGVPLLFLKGLAVGRLAYGDPFRKSAWDIDVLAPAAMLGEAAQVLGSVGFECVTPGRGASLPAWHRRSKESVWRDGAGLHVELHTALSDHGSLIPAIGLDSPRQRVDVGSNVVLETLARDELHAYLCVHGASSAWFRLKWIADLAGTVAERSQDEVARLQHRALELGAGRAAGLALLLASELFGLLPPDAPLLRAVARDRATRWLVGLARRQLLSGEPTERRLGTLGIHATQLLLAPGPKPFARELSRQMVAAGVRG